MRKFYLVLSLAFLLMAETHFALSVSIATDSTRFVVGQIKVFGNEITKDYVILDELPFSVGDTITNADLRYAKERVYSLKLFNFVDLVTDSKNPRRIIILVKEAWYIFPVPFIVFRKNSIKYSNYGINFLWKNFRGRNETIAVNLSLGFDPSFYASYFNPNFIGEKIRFRVAGGAVGILNKSLSFEKKFAGEEFYVRSYFGTLGAGYRTAFHSTADFFVSFRHFKLDKPYSNLYFASGGTSENSLSLTVNWTYDSRNLTLNASEGEYISFIGDYSVALDAAGTNGYYGFFAEARKYFEIANTAIFRSMLKGKVFANKNNVPYYDKTYLGYTRFIRGHAYDKTEGYDYFFASTELAFPLIRNYRYAADLPFLPNALTATRFEAQLILFFDAGKTYDDEIKGKIPYGYGIGLNLLFLPYNALKFEFAWNEQKKWEFLFGTGFSF